MIIPDETLVSFLSHKDKVVRERIVYRFLKSKAQAKRFEKKIIMHCLNAISSFGIENNDFMLALLAQFSLLSKDLQNFCEQADKKELLPKTSKKLFSRTVFENVLETGVEKVLLKQNPEPLFSMRFKFSNDFFERYYIEKKKETFASDLKKKVAHCHANEVWSFLKSKFILSGSSVSEELNSHYCEMMLGLMQGRFTSVHRNEIRSFFHDLREGKKLQLGAVFFYLRCIEVLKLKDLADDIFVLLEKPSSKKLYLRTVEILSLFKSYDYAKKIAMFYKNPNTAPSLKSAIIAFYSLNGCEYEEKFLLSFAKNEKNKRWQLEIAIALSAIFSSHFIPYALSLLNKKMDYHFFDLEEEVLVFSLISDTDTIENKGFRSFANSYFKRRAMHNFQPRLPFFIRKNLKQLWQDS